MTDKTTPADRIRGHTDASPRANGRWTGFLAHRWPAALGLALAVLIVYDLEVDAESVSSLSALTVLLALVYLGAAALDRPWSAWVLLLAGFAVLAIMPSTWGAIPAVVFLVAAVAFLILGMARGQLRKPGGLPLQTVGMLAFSATVLVALSVDLDLGAYLVAFALIGHAAWDAYHYRLNRVVSRSYAEFCTFVDILLGAAILVIS